jgi:hypothetical protein
MLARLDQPEPPRAAHERAAAADLSQSLLELALARAERPHLGRAHLQRVPCLHVRVHRAVVEKREQDGDPKSDPAGNAPAGATSFSKAGHGQPMFVALGVDSFSGTVPEELSLQFAAATDMAGAAQSGLSGPRGSGRGPTGETGRFPRESEPGGEAAASVRRRRRG